MPVRVGPVSDVGGLSWRYWGKTPLAQSNGFPGASSREREVMLKQRWPSTHLSYSSLLLKLLLCCSVPLSDPEDLDVTASFSLWILIFLFPPLIPWPIPHPFVPFNREALASRSIRLSNIPSMSPECLGHLLCCMRTNSENAIFSDPNQSSVNSDCIKHYWNKTAPNLSMPAFTLWQQKPVAHGLQKS